MVGFAKYFRRMLALGIYQAVIWLNIGQKGKLLKSDKPKNRSQKERKRKNRENKDKEKGKEEGQKKMVALLAFILATEEV